MLTFDVLLGVQGAPNEPRVLWRRGTKPEDRTREAQLLERVRRYAQLVRSEIGSAILLNGANVPWRRNFSLAHESFIS